MEAHPRGPCDLLESKEHQQIPAFLGTDAWSGEDQSAPPWDDAFPVAETHVGTNPKAPHLGAVVHEAKPAVAGNVTRHEVVDDQRCIADWRAGRRRIPANRHPMPMVEVLSSRRQDRFTLVADDPLGHDHSQPILKALNDRGMPLHNAI